METHVKRCKSCSMAAVVLWVDLLPSAVISCVFVTILFLDCISFWSFCVGAPSCLVRCCGHFPLFFSVFLSLFCRFLSSSSSLIKSVIDLMVLCFLGFVLCVLVGV